MLEPAVRASGGAQAAGRAGLWWALLACLAGCAAKEPPARAPEPETPGRTSLAWVRLAGEDAARFGAQVAALSKSPPSGLRSGPAASGRELLYGEFKFGGGTSRRIVFALDAGPSEGEPSAWRLYVDSDLDGDLSDELELRAAPVETKGARTARFPAIDVARPFGGRHALAVSVLVGAKWSVAEFRSACALAGKVDLFGARRDCVVYDANADGVFGETLEAPDRPGDAIWIDANGDGRAGEDELRALSPRLLLGGRALAIQVSDSERSLRIEETSVAFGRLARAGGQPGEELKVQLFSREWGLLPPSAAEAPTGEWRLLAYELVRKAADGEPWVLAGAWLPTQAPSVKITPAGATLVFGPPVEARGWVRYGRMVAPSLAQADAAAGPTVPEALVLVTLRGSGGEQVRVARLGSGEDWGEFRVVDASAAEIGSGRLEPLALLPGSAGARWSPPAGLQKGAPLRLVVARDLGPFSEGFRGESAFEFGLPSPVQLVVSAVEPAGQAAAAGVRPGDVIVRYDGKRIGSPLELALAMKDAEGKERVELVVLRQGVEYAFPLVPGRIGVETILAMP